MLKIAELCVTLHGILEKSLIRMKKIKTTYLLIAILLGLTACSQTDDTTVTLYDDAAIGSFTLGNVKRVVNGVKSTVAGSTYTFHIDQMTRTIYNTDSLPVGCDVSRVVCSIATYNNSGAFLISEDETTMTYYNGTDSIDFTKPRKFRVIASSGNGYNDYTIKVNVHKQDPEAFVWKKMSNAPTMTALRIIEFGEHIYLFGNEGGTTKGYKTANGEEWTPIALPALTQADAWENAVANSDSLYILDGTAIYRSSDAQTWTKDESTLPDGITLKRLLGASTTEVYAQATDGSLVTKYCDDELPIWVEAKDETESSFGELPTEDLTIVSYPMYLSDSTDYVLMAGNKFDGSEWSSRSWRRIVDYSETGIISLLKQYIATIIQDEDSYPEWIRKWTYLDRGNDHRYELPALKNVQIVWYDDVLLAFGGKGLTETIEPMTGILKSRDNGITWKADNDYAMPPKDGESIFDLSTSSFSAAVCNGYIWIVCADTGEVWRGQLNRVAWEK